MILYLDCETDGLWKDGLPADHPSQPNIVQLSALLTNINNVPRGQLDVIIKPEEGREIPKVASDIHGITTAVAHEYGVPLLAALACFNGLAAAADRVVAYNTGFDLRCVKRAFSQVNRPDRLPAEAACVMMMARDVVQLPSDFPGGEYRWPKLGVTYQHLFGQALEGAHNSWADVLATQRIYLELKRRGVADELPTRDRNTMNMDAWKEHGRNYDQLLSLLEAARLAQDLTAWEQSFVADLNKRVAEYQERVRMSDRQWSALERIGEKSRGRQAEGQDRAAP